MVQGITVSNSYQNEQYPSYITGTLDQSSNAPSYFSGLEEASLTSNIAAKRAQRYDFALGEQSPGEEKLYQESLYGEESSARIQRSLENRINLNSRRAKLAQSFIANTPTGSITQDDLDLIQQLDKDEVDLAYSNPETFYEHLYAKKAAVNKTQDLIDNGEDPRDPVSVVSKTYNHLQVNQGTALKFLEETRSKLDERTWGQAAKEWIPFWRWLKLSSNFEDETTEGGFFLGSNRRDQVEALWRLPPNEFYEESKKIIEQLNESDPQLAHSFASALVGYSASDELFDDLNSVLDLTIFGFTPKGVLQTGKALGALSTASIVKTARAGLSYGSNLNLLRAHGRMQNMIKNGIDDPLSVLPEFQAAHIAAYNSLRAKAANTNQIGDLEALFGTIQDIHNPNSVLTGAQNLTAEEAARIEIGLLKTSTSAMENLISRPKLLHRLSESEVALATSEAEQFVSRMYAKSTLGSRFVKVKMANVDQGESLANVDAIKVYLGNKQAKGFATEAAAKTQATKLSIPKYGVEQANGSWYITLAHYVDESTSTIRAFAKDPKFDIKDRTPYLHAITSRIRAKDSIVPNQLIEDLLVAQSAVNGYFNANKHQFLDDFGKLSGKAKKRMDEFLERERDYRFQDGPPEDVVRGRYAQNIGELQARWMNDYGSLPSIQEIQTYFAWKNWNDVDYAIRNLDLTRDKVRLGIMSHTFRYRQPGKDAEWTPKLEGKLLQEFPWERPGNAGILVWDSAESHLMTHPESYKIPGVNYSSTKPPRNIYQKQYIRDFEKEHIDTLIERDGYRVVHLSPHSKQDLADFLGSWGKPDDGTPPSLIPEKPSVDVQATVDPELRQKFLEGKLTSQERGLYADQARREAAKFDQLYINTDDKVSKNFYYVAAVDNQFRNKFHNLTDPVDQLNALADYLVYPIGEKASRVIATRDVKNPDLKAIQQYVYQSRKHDIDNKLDKIDVTKLNKKAKVRQQGIYSTEEIINYGKELKTIRDTAEVKDTEVDYKQFKTNAQNLDKNITEQFEVFPITKEGKLLTVLSNPNELSNATTARVSHFRKDAPYYLLSDKGSDVQGNHLILNGPMKAAKKRLQELFPDLNIMTSSEAITFIRSGKLPKKSLSQRAEEAAEASIPSEGYDVGDEVIVLTPEDKKELAKTGSIKAADKAPKHKIAGVLDDPKRPDLGTYVRLEGSNTGFPASDLYLVNKGKVSELPEVAAKTAEIESGLDVGRYDYILIRPETDMKSTTLDFINFPRTEGGHMVNEDSWHIRQAQMYSSTEARSPITTYEGDVNAYTAVIEADARDTATHLENMRNILKNDLDNGTNYAETIYNKSLDGLSKNFKAFKRQFREFHKQGKLRLDRPFVVTAKDRSSYDALKGMIDADGNPLYPNLQNHRDSPHNLYYNELNLQYALERSDGLERIARKGTAQNPVFASDSGGSLSPMSTIINSQSELMRNRMLSDLKIKNAENFAKYFSDVIDAPLEDIRRDPMEYILNPKWKRGLKGNDLRMLNAAKDFRRAVIDFLGVENPIADMMKTFQATVAEGLKRKLNQGAYEHIDRHLMRGRHISPVRWANAMVYDLFFGVFNLKQMFVQSMTAYHTAAVLGPKTGLSAGMAAHLARWVLFDKAPERLDHVARMVGKAGFMPEDQFKEAVTAYRNSGFHIIGQETSFEDDFIHQSIKSSGFERGRDAARVFFKEGDRYSRTTAYLGAYKEWRKSNPNAKLTPRIENEILARANTLSLSMTGASQASMAKGIGNIPLKFTTYHLRMMEQLLPGWTGGPLTAKEKMRAYAMYSVLFGAPVTASGAFGLWPFHKEVAKILEERGYETDENLVLKAFNDGLAETLPSLIGIDQTFSETLGPSGTNWLYDIVEGETPIFDVITGVGGTKLYDVVAESWPFFTMMSNAFRDDVDKYPLSLADWEKWFRSVSSVNNYWRAIQMYNTGTYFTKNRTPLMRGVDTSDVLSSLFFGTQPKEVQRAFLQSDMTRATQDMKKAAAKDIIRWHRLQMKAIIDDDLDAFEEFGKKIKQSIITNGFLPTEFNKLFTDVVSKNRDLVTLADRKYHSSTPERQKMFHNKMKKKHNLEEE